MKTVVCKCCKHEREVLTGAELKYFRVRNQLSLRQASEILKVSVSFLSDCEHDRRNSSDLMRHWVQMYELRHMLFKKGQK